MGIAITPSMLSADFANLQRELERISTADAAHIDVMDNHFVPNLTWGPPVVKRLREISPVPFDVHLMIEDADRWAPQYASMGCESVTFHAEAAIAPIKLARTLRAEGAKAGMALRPATAVEPYLDMLSELDMLLIMRSGGGHRLPARGGRLGAAFQDRMRLRPLAALADGGTPEPAHPART